MGVSWKDLLATTEEHTLPWTGGRAIHGAERSWTVDGKLPPEVGWHRFQSGGSRKATWVGEGFLDPAWAEGREVMRGYLVGDRIIPDHIAVHPDVRRVMQQTEQIWLVESGLDRFARVQAVKGPSSWVYMQQEFPLGPELDVQTAYEDRADSVDDLPNVPPALDLAFRWLTWRRLLSEERQAEVDLWREIAAEEAEEARNAEAARQWIEAQQQLARDPSSGFDRRARTALALSGSQLLDSRDGRTPSEKVVLFRFQSRRFECVVDAASLRIIDSGICLDGYDNNFTLESLPGVIGEAMGTQQLHVYRHADENYHD